MNKADIDGLTVQEWKLLEGYVEVLRSIANFTAEMGSRSKPTLSMVLPVLFEIKSSLEDIIKKAPKGTGILFARKLLAIIKLRFIDSNYWESPLYRIAMLLDLRFKNTLLSNKDSASLLEEKAIEALRENTKSTTFETKVHINQSLPESFTKRSKWGHLKKKVNIRNINSPNEETKIRIEVENYLKSPTISEQEDPLTWWKVNALTFPFLVPLARRYLAIAATETSSERVFSVEGNVVTNKRTNLLAEN
ncbi:zinc finger BED domain-containing protein 4-like, partial [Pseudomyrmex gracilis]|uniref:zinc finger BED domain-containing protein 4-like n=1 Tax=Pseudomyrmex gracilis TaxID=219809 RepID=UPI00099556D4